MSWRTVIIHTHSKLNYKNGFMVVRNETVQMIHLSEIHTVLVDSTLVSITTALICEIMHRKIKLIFCDEKHNPKGELISYYGSHNTSKKIMQQMQWSDGMKDYVWMRIVKQKIMNQAKILRKFTKENEDKLEDYAREVVLGDTTNREGHAAKVYFNSLFGRSFTRDGDNDINASLDYGYAILLSSFNKEIVSNGYLTQLGIHHKNEFNFFNFSCDLMEPFRVLIDEEAYLHHEEGFGQDMKHRLVNVLNSKVRINRSEHFVTTAIQMYVKNICNVLETGSLDDLNFVEVI